MINKTNTIPIAEACPDCGRYKKPLFFRGDILSRHNIHCKCHNKNKGLGFDVNIELNQSESLLYWQTTCSGISNEWEKENLRCPICQTFYSKIKVGDNGFSINCKNINCPSLGFDFGYENNFAFVTASGIENDIRLFCQNEYDKSLLNKRILVDQSNLSY